MIIKVDDDVYLSPYKESDAERLVTLLKDEEIARNTFIPNPYSLQDAIDWIEYSTAQNETAPFPFNPAIRHIKEGLIGGIGLKLSNHPFEQHKAEVGYWLSAPHRNRSIVSNSLKVFTSLAIEKLQLVKLYAPILKRNIASQRAAEKAGYTFEAELKKHYLKDDQYLDGVIYSYFNTGT